MCANPADYRFTAIELAVIVLFTSVTSAVVGASMGSAIGNEHPVLGRFDILFYIVFFSIQAIYYIFREKFVPNWEGTYWAKELNRWLAFGTMGICLIARRRVEKNLTKQSASRSA